MSRGVRGYLAGFVVLVALAGCGRGIMHYVQREPWREQAETACMKSGAVKQGRIYDQLLYARVNPRWRGVEAAWG